jgi:hypothetical protein
MKQSGQEDRGSGLVRSGFCRDRWRGLKGKNRNPYEFDNDNPDIEIKRRGKDKRLTDEERRLLKRRQAIEPIIGHLKADHRMDRRQLKGLSG